MATNNHDPPHASGTGAGTDPPASSGRRIPAAERRARQRARAAAAAAATPLADESTLIAQPPHTDSTTSSTSSKPARTGSRATAAAAPAPSTATPQSTRRRPRSPSVVSTSSTSSTIPADLPPFLAAVARGDVHAVDHLLKSSSSDGTDAPWHLRAPNTGSTALHLAVAARHPAIVTLLCTNPRTRPALIHERDAAGYTPIARALESRRRFSPDIVRALLDAGADPTLVPTSADNATPTDMLVACIRSAGRDPSLLAELVSKFPPATIAARDRDGWTPLQIAAKYADADRVRVVLGTGMADPNDMGPERWGALHIAAYDGHVEVVRTLVEHGADARQVGREGMAPAHAAAQMARVDVLDVLVAHGADLMQTDAEGWTPLAWAVAQADDLAAVAHVLELTGTDAARAFRTAAGESLVDVALQNRRVEHAVLLLQEGVRAVATMGVADAPDTWVDALNAAFDGARIAAMVQARVDEEVDQWRKAHAHLVQTQSWPAVQHVPAAVAEGDTTKILAGSSDDEIPSASASAAHDDSDDSSWPYPRPPIQCASRADSARVLQAALDSHLGAAADVRTHAAADAGAFLAARFDAGPRIESAIGALDALRIGAGMDALATTVATLREVGAAAAGTPQMDLARSLAAFRTHLAKFVDPVVDGARTVAQLQRDDMHLRAADTDAAKDWKRFTQLTSDKNYLAAITAETHWFTKSLELMDLARSLAAFRTHLAKFVDPVVDGARTVAQLQRDDMHLPAADTDAAKDWKRFTQLTSAAAAGTPQMDLARSLATFRTHLAKFVDPVDDGARTVAQLQRDDMHFRAADTDAAKDWKRFTQLTSDKNYLAAITAETHWFTKSLELVQRRGDLKRRVEVALAKHRKLLAEIEKRRGVAQARLDRVQPFATRAASVADLRDDWTARLVSPGKAIPAHGPLPVTPPATTKTTMIDAPPGAPWLLEFCALFLHMRGARAGDDDAPHAVVAQMLDWYTDRKAAEAMAAHTSVSACLGVVRAHARAAQLAAQAVSEAFAATQATVATGVNALQGEAVALHAAIPAGHHALHVRLLDALVKCKKNIHDHTKDLNDVSRRRERAFNARRVGEVEQCAADMGALDALVAKEKARHAQLEDLVQRAFAAVAPHLSAERLEEVRDEYRALGLAVRSHAGASGHDRAAARAAFRRRSGRGAVGEETVDVLPPPAAATTATTSGVKRARTRPSLLRRNSSMPVRVGAVTPSTDGGNETDDMDAAPSASAAQAPEYDDDPDEERAAKRARGADGGVVATPRRRIPASELAARRRQRIADRASRGAIGSGVLDVVLSVPRAVAQWTAAWWTGTAPLPSEDEDESDNEDQEVEATEEEDGDEDEEEEEDDDNEEDSLGGDGDGMYPSVQTTAVTPTPPGPRVVRGVAVRRTGGGDAGAPPSPSFD
ncbi:hypothetical protein AMAG_15888 [Allomyces macrogynus ATCC 38327]|uniref:Peptidase A2 domain-containing protein n=1 Tax=Allomyces macrogynus (strain ATCC 38327) TaxID=578462 RepID=A0A0L0T8U2_ALLM3|nr:hypothetical protein AMAG_15888 [Allomyces macrogynus ATCC 38327]|eukprot:KNE71233.1 hypothetical protein AMAG_15888 [Allomyces macrogynus ATCC 38327]